MLIEISASQAALILRLIKSGMRGYSLNDALDALQLSLNIPAAPQTLSDSDAKIIQMVDAPQRVAQDDHGPLIKRGEFDTCCAADVDYYKGLGYSVNFDAVLNDYLVSPPAFCTHGRAFNLPCEYCGADASNKVASFNDSPGGLSIC
jgi:hypothetical protein